MAFDTGFTPPPRFDEYKVIRPLGQGAMGQVFLCQDVKLDRLVAVKFIRGIYADPELTARFAMEARAIARLNHQNVVAVYRMGECEGLPYIASQFIPGDNLERLRKPVPWPQALRIALGLARGLAAAHRQLVLHRDIKPANIMLAEDGEVKLLDFGLAKLMDSMPRPSLGSSGVDHPNDTGLLETISDTLPKNQVGVNRRHDSLTQTGSLMGTPLFMSPEAWRGERPTAASDVFSLGVVLYELVAGFLPQRKGAESQEGEQKPADQPDQAPGASSLDGFPSSLVLLRDAVLNIDPEPLFSVAPHADRRFCELIDRCIKRNPDERFASANELYSELEELQFQTAASSRSMISIKHRPRWGLGIGVVACIGFLVSGGWLGHELLYNRSEMVLLQGGTFQMGSTANEIESAFDWCKLEAGENCIAEHYQREQPTQQVTISDFRLDRREVTNAAFVDWLNRQISTELREDKYIYQQGVLLANIYPTIHPSHGIVFDTQSSRYRVLPSYENKPVTQITWDAANRYCRDHHKRLPTEAEWEYAARGRSGRRFPWGNDEPRCNGVTLAQQKGQLCQRSEVGPNDVGTSPQDRTPEGIFDLGGNVSEWVADRFLSRYAVCSLPCKDPAVGAESAEGVVQRVVRGGSYNLPGATGRAASRSRWRQDEGLINIGFRCASSKTN